MKCFNANLFSTTVADKPLYLNGFLYITCAYYLSNQQETTMKIITLFVLFLLAAIVAGIQGPAHAIDLEVPEEAMQQIIKGE